MRDTVCDFSRWSKWPPASRGCFKKSSSWDLTNTRYNSLYALGQAAWEHGNSCNSSGMKTVTSSDWIPAVAGIQLYREVFEVSEFIVTLIAVSKTSRYNPFALRRSSITRSDRAKRISYFQFLLSYLTLSFLFILFSFVSPLSTANWRLLLPTFLWLQKFLMEPYWYTKEKDINPPDKGL